MVKCILKGLSQTDPYSGEMREFETTYNGIPEACSFWASGYKHCFLDNCQLFYAENGLEVPERITDYYYDRYYYGRFVFDEHGEEAGHSRWTFVYIPIYYGSYEPQPNPSKVGVLLRK